MSDLRSSAPGTPLPLETLAATDLSALTRSELLALMRASLHRCWRQEHRVSVETMLARLPRLKSDAEAVLSLIDAEVSLREEVGETPSSEEYQRRFPDLAASLERQLAYRRALADPLFRDMLGSALPAADVAAADQTRTMPPPGTGRDARAGVTAGTADQIDDQAEFARRASRSGGQLPSVPGYEIEAELGRGGMGVVYRAVQRAARRTVAMKMTLSGDQADERDRVRFKTEAEAMARVQHPGVVQVFEVGEHLGLPFFSMEFCGGGSLQQRLAGTPLPPGEAAELVRALTGAVQAAHDKGVLHRDLKPANVLLTEGGTPKLTDFGLAKKLDAAGNTQSGAVMGTPSYMAPEQAQGKVHELGPACDVYALGAILYECLTGRPPFKAASVMETLMQVIGDEPAAVRQLNPQVPRDLETVCLKCLRKAPGRAALWSAWSSGRGGRRTRQDGERRHDPTIRGRRDGENPKRKPSGTSSETPSGKGGDRLCPLFSDVSASATRADADSRQKVALTSPDATFPDECRECHLCQETARCSPAEHGRANSVGRKAS